MAGRLAGKHALVTAAGNGIGKAIAQTFHAEGATVIACDIDAQALQSLADAGITTRVLDATDSSAIAALIAEAGTLDVLVNAVGYVDGGTILDCSREAWERSWHINVTSMYELCRAVLPGMLAQGSGSIVNIASVASSLKGVPNRFVYGTTKAAVIGLSKAIAADFVARGIRCNAICPGTIESPSLQARIAEQAAQSQSDAGEVKNAFIARQPVGRLGTPEEVAALALYLASDESGFTTGATHTIDGGWLN